MPLTLGIDVGTGSTKGALVDVEGRFFASASYAYRYTVPVPQSAEQDPDVWWDAVCRVCRQLLQAHPEAIRELKAVAVSGQGVAAVVLDRCGEPVRDAMLWMDTRCSLQAEALSRDHGDTIARITGKQPAAYALEPKLIWMRQNEPELWRRVWKVMTTTAYVNLRLTGVAAMNHSDAGILLAYDLKRRCWSGECIFAMGLQPDIFCDLAECDEVIGRVTSEAARQSGLPEGLPVVGGGEDTSSTGLALGVASERDVQLSMGTACTVNVPFTAATVDARLLAFPHVLRGLTLTGGSMISGGLSVEWLLNLFEESTGTRQASATMLDELTICARQVPSGSGGVIFMPYLAGELQPINDGFARGIFFGVHLGTRREHLFRAVLEGTANAIEHNLGILREHGAQPQMILASGTPAKNDLWCQIIADMTGLPLKAMDEHVGAALGDSILAAMGAGLITDPLAMQRAHARVRAEFHSQFAAHENYQALHSIYREVYPRLRDLFPRLAAVTTT